MEYATQLAHHGIKGMRWGVRRTPEQLARAKGHVDAAANMVRESKNITNAVGNIRSAVNRTDLSSMTDQELRERVNRMNLEQQYSMLSSNRISKGEAFVKNTLDVAGGVLAIASSALTIAVAIKKLKG